MKIKDLLLWAKKELREANVAEPESSAEFLLREVLSVERAGLFASLGEEMTSGNVRKFQKYIRRRKKHEPVWQIVGKVEFWGKPFVVNRNVLIPRPETELLIEEGLKYLKSAGRNLESEIKILDVGTGSGAIAITLAAECKKRGLKCRVFASDVSRRALSVAKKNAKRLNQEITFRSGDLFEPWKKEKFNLIAANLPYIPEEDMGGIAFDIHHYEPRLALSGGFGGLVVYERFLSEIHSRLECDGLVICEITKNQGKQFCQLAKKYLPEKECLIIKDLAGIDRIVIIQ